MVDDGEWFYLGAVVAGFDVGGVADDEEAFEPVAVEAVDFVSEAVSVGAHAALDEVVDGFAFDGEDVLGAFEGVVAGVERGGARAELCEAEGGLLAGVDDDGWAGGVVGGERHRDCRFRIVDCGLMWRGWLFFIFLFCP